MQKAEGVVARILEVDTEENDIFPLSLGLFPGGL